MAIQSLHYRGAVLSNAEEQLKILDTYSSRSFDSHLKENGLDELKSRKIDSIVKPAICSLCPAPKSCKPDAFEYTICPFRNRKIAS